MSLIIYPIERNGNIYYQDRDISFVRDKMFYIIASTPINIAYLDGYLLKVYNYGTSLTTEYHLEDPNVIAITADMCTSFDQNERIASHFIAVCLYEDKVAVIKDEKVVYMPANLNINRSRRYLISESTDYILYVYAEQDKSTIRIDLQNTVTERALMGLPTFHNIPYASSEEFRLLKNGCKPFGHDPNARNVYFIIHNNNIWGCNTTLSITLDKQLEVVDGVYVADGVVQEVMLHPLRFRSLEPGEQPYIYVPPSMRTKSARSFHP